MCLPADNELRKNTAGSDKVVLEWMRPSEFPCRMPAGKLIQIEDVNRKRNSNPGFRGRGQLDLLLTGAW
ncbi:ATP-dependent RNA helicase DDX31 [Biomphalaria pfeifferi]|uniref:ATP-dependent RNA helicase DDX31 n=1 Tax=Biomphalaria pfeifferi TaxID=112525 RepID=A0AAD8FLH2_BIOPF|nr:ATP-dependent RNA helicase DDX31 [Biomphalaria pfeifferi]